MRIIGLDIGGANLKAADNDGTADSQPFPLWKQPERLAAALRELLTRFAMPDRFAVTMTGELADCFETKADGVSQILAAVEQAAGGTPLTVWQTGGEFVSPAVAREIPLLVAAANWHALATFCGRMVPAGSALLIDVGSTTTDVIPLREGCPVPSGFTDFERLQSGELVYTGVRRTPVCALAPQRTPGALPCSLAAELFATTLDVYLTLGDIASAPANCDTANGKPATKSAAIDRLARMFCCDRTELSADAIFRFAETIAAAQVRMIHESITRVLQPMPSPCRQVILSGSGHFLGHRAISTHSALVTAEIQSLPALLGPEIASAACAFAVARLAAEQ